MSLHHPRHLRILAGLGAWLVYVLLRLLLLLPNTTLSFFCRPLRSLLLFFLGMGPEERALKDLTYIFGHDQKSADLLRRMMTQSSPVELRGIIRGGILRSLT